MDVFQNFLLQVFDTPMDPNSFILDKNIIMERIYDHPLLQENALFHHTYRHFFGIFATSHMFQQRSGSDFLDSPCFDILRMFSSAAFPHSDPDKFRIYIASIKEQLKTKEFRNSFIITKICERHNITTFDLKKNPLLFYVNLQPPSYSFVPNINPITNKRIMTHEAPTPLDAIMADKQFLIKMLQHPVIAIDCHIPVPILNALIECLNDVASPLVLDLTASLPQDHIAATVYTISQYLYNHLPIIADIFILISDCTHPPYKSLSQNTQKSFYYMRAWTASSLRDNLSTFESQYARILTSVPYEMSTIFRVLDFFDVVPSQALPPSSNHIILAGKHSNIPDNDAEAKRVIIYSSPQNDSLSLTHIIDETAMIPPEIIYKLVIFNRLPHDRIISPKVPIFPNTLLCAHLFTKNMFKKIWQSHLKATTDNIIYFYEFILSFFERLSPSSTPMTFSSTPTPNTLVLIDNRENPLSITSVLMALCNVREPTTCHVFTCTKSRSYYLQYLQHFNVNIIDYPDLNKVHFNIDVYNQILKSQRFWKTLADHGATKAIIIQDDGILARPGIEALIKPWDYIGAPWADVPGNEYIRDNITRELVGNGGFSARDIAKCLMITQKYEDEKHQLFYQDLVEIPEDVYFVSAMKKEGFKIAPRDIASQFASEQTLNPSAIGFHKPWAYCDTLTIKDFFTKILVM